MAASKLSKRLVHIILGTIFAASLPKKKKKLSNMVRLVCFKKINIMIAS